MSDMGMGGGEMGLGGLFSANIAPSGLGRAFGRRGRQVTGNVSASLKFDIPGLKSFGDELRKINDALGKLDATFRKIAKGPEEWAEQLKAVNAQLKEMKTLGGDATKAQDQQGVAGVSTGTGQLISAAGLRTQQASTLSGIGKFANVLGQGGGLKAATGAGVAAVGGPATLAFQGAGAVSNALGEGLKMMFERFDRNMEEAISADPFATRRAVTTGRTAQQQFQDFAGQGGGFMTRDLTSLFATLAQAQNFGAYAGAQGLPGQRGQAFVTGMKAQQFVQPGVGQEELAGNIQGMFSNVSGITRGMARYGSQASPYKPGGGAKTIQEYYTDIMHIVEKLPRRDGSTGKPSKEWFMLQNMPGSSLWDALVRMGLPEDQIPEWFDWAIMNSVSRAAGLGELATNDPKRLKRQLESDALRGEESAATVNQRLQTEQAQREGRQAGAQYDTIKERLKIEQKVNELLTKMDEFLDGVYAVTGVVPKAGQGMAEKGVKVASMTAMGAMIGSVVPGLGTGLGAALGFGLGMLGDPGYGGIGDAGMMGDTSRERGLSHLTPDLRKRVGRMMADNPALEVNSAYRDNLRQDRLQGKGPFAPSGKSKHGQGQAVDMGPRDQMGWLAKNARKYGLGTAGHMGEPWHVQLGGTMGFMGDPGYGWGMGDTMTGSQQARLSEAMIRSDVSAMQQRLETRRAAAATASGAVGAVGGGVGGGGGGSVVSPATDTGALPPDVAEYSTRPYTIKTALNFEDVTKIAYAAGFRGTDLINMVSIAYRESSHRPMAHNPNAGTGDNSYGLWQINMLGSLGPARMKDLGITKNEELFDPNLNAKAAYQLFTAGGGGTKGLRPWGGYKKEWNFDAMTNAYPYVDDATAAAKKLGYVGDIGWGGREVSYGNDDGTAAEAMAMSSPTRFSGGGGGFSVRSAPVTFNNNFNITMPSGSTRYDADVVTSRIARQLESQLSRAVSRKA